MTAVDDVVQHIDEIHILGDPILLAEVMPVKLAVAIPPVGLGKAGQEVPMEPLDVGQLVPIMRAGSLQQLATKKA
jgi:hypothetical protein